MVFLMNCTWPSQNITFTPPGCRLRAAFQPGRHGLKLTQSYSNFEFGVNVLNGGIILALMSVPIMVKKRFVGTFIGSMMTNLWVYDGELDPAAKVLTLDSEGPSFTTEGKMAKYRDVIEIKTEDHRVLTSNFLGDEGEWHHFMTANYRRKK